MSFKIYTKTGDQGETGLFGGTRLPKDHIRIESYGTVDELNAHVGMLRDHVEDGGLRDLLKKIQDRLFTIGSNLASDPEKELPTPDILDADIELLEQEMDRMDETLPELRNFILPGGHPAVSWCHLARCVCRRAERRVITLTQQESVAEIIIRYLNRLSDYFFMLGRYLAQQVKAEEVVWKAR